MSDKQAKPEMPFHDPNDNFFPHLRQFIADNPDAFKDLHIDCTVCCNEIPMQPLPLEGGSLDDDNGTPYPGLGLLACGHIFCGPCIMQWFAGCGDRGKSCPMCRQGSSVSPKNLAYVIRSAEDASLAPKCLNEGGSFPEAFPTKASHMLLRQVPGLVLNSLSNFGTMPPEGIETSKLIEDCMKSTVVLAQMSWGYTLIIGWESGSTKTHWTYDSIELSMENDRIVEMQEETYSSEALPCTFPLFATEDGHGRLSHILRKENSERDEVWGPQLVGFGIGFCDDIDPINRPRLVEAMSVPYFASSVALHLWPWLREQGKKESVSTLLR